MIKIGASSLAEDSQEKFLEYTADLKLKYAEIVKAFPNHEINTELLESYNFKYSIHSPLIDINIASLTPSIRKASINEIKNAIDDATKINAKNVVIHPGKISFAGQTHEDTIYNLCNDAFKTIKEYSTDTGVNPLIENMPLIRGFMYYDLDKLYNTLEELDMDMTLDIGHAFTAGYKENQMYNKRVKHIHIHDNNGEDDSHLPLGEGKIQFNNIINKYSQENYKGTYIIESSNLDSIKTTLQYLKKNKHI